MTVPSLSLLKQYGLKDTMPRRAVLQALAKAAKPLSVQDIFRKLPEDAHIGLVTIYRVAGAFQNAGLLHRHPSGELSLCTLPGIAGHHLLLRCTRCRAVEEEHDDELCRREEMVAKRHGFRPVQHTSELLGTCARCS